MYLIPPPLPTPDKGWAPPPHPRSGVRGREGEEEEEGVSLKGLKRRSTPPRGGGKGGGDREGGG